MFTEWININEDDVKNEQNTKIIGYSPLSEKGSSCRTGFIIPQNPSSEIVSCCLIRQIIEFVSRE